MENIVFVENYHNYLHRNIYMENNDLEISNKKKVIDFFNKININIIDIENLEGKLIERNSLISLELYNNIKNDIIQLKTILNSSNFTSMQKNAETNQQWPLLNLVRQLLKKYEYNLIPKRLADGYTKDGNKKYKRIFEIKKVIINNK